MTDFRPAVPLSARVRDLLERSEAELVAAQRSAEPWERFSHAHLAAVRASAALLAARPHADGRRAPRTVWGLLDAAAPELGRWSRYFADGAALRSAVEAGRFEAVSADRAAATMRAADELVDAVRSAIEGDAGSQLDEPVPYTLVPRRAWERAS